MAESYLLDSSALIALLIEDHASRSNVIAWLERTEARFLVCSIAQGAFLRLFMRIKEGALFSDGQAILLSLAQMPGYQFLSDNGDYLEVPVRGIRGPAQVTDAYFAWLARKNGCRLATLDRAQAALYADITERIPEI